MCRAPRWSYPLDMARTWSIALLGVPLWVACGDDGAGSGGSTSSASVTSSTSTGAGPATTATGGTGGGGIVEDFVAGGARPVTVKLPESYDPSVPSPLLILLHGYTATGAIQNAYFGMEPVADANGLIYAYPDGTVDAQDAQFWNATDACCDFFGTGVDDVGYLLGLVDEIESKVNVDPKRIYFVGHSNGGFMSFRLACEASDRIAAIASLAGATFDDPTDCSTTSPLSVLQIHGDLDDTILYGGGSNGTVSYPSAAASVAHFAGLAGCDPGLSLTATTYDLETRVAGAETTVEEHVGCAAGYGAELWTIVGGGHVPSLTPDFSEEIVAFFLAHPKP